MSLPLPWWQRAPLGFLHATDVHVGLVKGSRPVADIVVSALDITKWDNMVRLDCSHSEERGVLAKLMEAVLPLNVALAEAVTTETGKEHRATLFCEDKGILKVKDVIPRIEASLRRGGFEQIVLEPYLSTVKLPILEYSQRSISHGWLNGIPYKEMIAKHYDEANRKTVDLTRAVVSADTENRLLRYVFPYRGARTIRIKHTDRPGALRFILQEFNSCDLNVLSAVLRRGGQQAGYSELIAVCEPQSADAPLEVYERLRERLSTGGPEYDVTLRLSEGRPADDVIYLPPPRQVIPSGMRSVYFGTKCLTANPKMSELVNNVRLALQSLRFFPLELTNSVNSMTFLKEADTLVERCEAALILVDGFAGFLEEHKFDVLQAIGYLRALNKPTLIITTSIDGAVIEKWIRGSTNFRVEFMLDDQIIRNGDRSSLTNAIGGIFSDMLVSARMFRSAAV